MSARCARDVAAARRAVGRQRILRVLRTLSVHNAHKYVTGRRRNRRPDGIAEADGPKQVAIEGIAVHLFVRNIIMIPYETGVAGGQQTLGRVTAPIKAAANVMLHASAHIF